MPKPSRVDEPSAAGILARAAYDRARQAGVALDPLLKKAGLTRGQIDNPGIRITVRDQIRLINLVAEALDDDYLGFHLAQAPELRDTGLLYYVMASSERLVDALRCGCRYNPLVNESISMTCREGKHLVLTLRYRGVPRHSDRHQMEFWLTSIVRTCRTLTGLRLLPIRVRFSHRREKLPHEIAEGLGTNVEFGAAVDDIAFEKKVGQYPIVTADPYLNRLLVRFSEKELARRDGRTSFRLLVENAIVPRLPHGTARADDIATELGMSPRTLARRLADEGVTFSGIVDNLRADLAQDYLADDKLSISQIAWLLGYREVGAFSHAFKRRTGKTPREVRARGATDADDRV